MGDVERIRPTLGSSFGHDLGQRIIGLGDKAPKKHHHDDAEQSKEDALELHEVEDSGMPPQTIQLTIDSTDHLDLSA